MLKNINIKGFKSIKNLNLELSNINILIGANGGGKSNFLNIFEFLGAIYRQELQKYSQIRGIDNMLFCGSKITDNIDLSFVMGDMDKKDVENIYHINLIPTQIPSLLISTEDIGFNDQKKCFNKPLIKNVCSNSTESMLRTKEINKKFKTLEKMYKSTRKKINDLRRYHFHDASPQARIKQECSANDNLFLKFDGSNLVAFLKMIKEKYNKDYRQIINTIQRVAPFFDDFIFRDITQKDELIYLEWYDKNSDMIFTAHSLSDGTLRFICLTTLLLQPLKLMPETIIIDEPELGLHPYAISVLAMLIQKISTRKQIIISTQSTELINYFKPEDIVVVEKIDNQSIFKRIKNDENLKEWLEEYSSISEIWKLNLIGGQP